MRLVRVLVFGATGSGKTSLCNALTGRSRPTDSGAHGVTAKTHIYPPVPIGDIQLEIVDTVGLHESSHGTVPADQAALQLISLLEKSRDGYSLLVHVMRASRITQEHEEDYAFFVEKLVQKRVPVILAVTGCENEHPMSAWVVRNRAAFGRFGYQDLIATCFANGGALEAHFEPLRAASKAAMLEAIEAFALPEPQLIYGPKTGVTFDAAFTRIWNEVVSLFGLPSHYRRRVNESAYQLLKRLGIPKKIADAAIRHIPDVLEEVGKKAPIPYLGKFLRWLGKIAVGKSRRRR